MEEFIQSKKSEDSFGELIEGWVFEDAKGYLFKYKTAFYRKWKRCRCAKERVQNGKEVKTQIMTQNDLKFLDFIKEKYSPEELKTKSLVNLRREFKNTEKEETIE